MADPGAWGRGRRSVGRGRRLGRGAAVLLSLAGLVGCRRAEPEPERSAARHEPPSAAAPAVAAASDVARSAAPTAPSGPTGPAPRYDVPLRSDEELRAEAARACRSAHERSTPLLLDVGADWCGDCRRLYVLEREEPLRSALEGWEVLSVNLGEERHEWLREAFGVRAIARWLALRPTDCSAALEGWPVVASRVVEPGSDRGFGGPRELVAWLAEAARAARQ